MIKLHKLLIFLVCVLVVTGCGKSKDKDGGSGDLQTETQKFSYSIGFDIGRSIAQLRNNVDIKLVSKGVEDGLESRKSPLSDRQREEIKASVVRELQENLASAHAELSKRTLNEGNRFLAENSQKPNVKVTASGLQYEVLTEGQGDHPKLSDRLVVNYKGTLTDGTIFESSYDRGQPANLPVSATMPGWREGLMLMTPGSRYKFYIPTNLAYGERSPNQKIAPNSVLIFETELLSVEKDTGVSVASSQQATTK